MIEITFSIKEHLKNTQDFIDKREDLISYDIFLKEDFGEIKGKGVVYFIFVISESKTELKYIGKSKGHLFKKRITDHFDHKSKKTYSKLAEIKKEINKGNKVKLSYILTNPESFRNVIEENLIQNNKSHLWNKQKG